MRWNILIALFAAAFALLQLGADALIYFNPDRTGLAFGDMLFDAVALIALLLSYPLFRARNWARVTLLVTLALCGVGVGLLVPFSFIANHWIYTRLVIAFQGASTVCVLILFIMLLLHPDVRRAFTQTV